MIPVSFARSCGSAKEASTPWRPRPPGQPRQPQQPGGQLQRGRQGERQSPRPARGSVGSFALGRWPCDPRGRWCRRWDRRAGSRGAPGRSATCSPHPQLGTSLQGHFPVFLSRDRSRGLGRDRSRLSSLRAEGGFGLKGRAASGVKVHWTRERGSLRSGWPGAGWDAGRPPPEPRQPRGAAPRGLTRAPWPRLSCPAEEGPLPPSETSRLPSLLFPVLIPFPTCNTAQTRTAVSSGVRKDVASHPGSHPGVQV